MEVSEFKACEAPEQGLDSLMWFKLLFVPTLGIVILTLFLLEEYCSSHKAKVEGEQKRKSGRKPGEPTRISLVDQNGVQSCYKIEPTISMKEVLKFYCEKHGFSSEEVVLRHEGRKLQLSATPDLLGLDDLTVIDVEPDYSKLLEDLQKETQSERTRLENLLEREKGCREASQAKLNHIQEEFQQLLQAGEELKKAVAGVESEKVRLGAALAKLERDLRTHQEARREADMARSTAERERDADAARKEKKRLEKLLSSARSELETKKKQLAEIRTQHEKGAKEQQDVECSLRETFSQLEGLEKEVNRWRAKANKLNAHREKLIGLENLRSLHASWRKKLEQAEKEHVVNSHVLTHCKQKAKDYDAAQKELGRAKLRLQTSEQELHDLETWKEEVGKGYAIENKKPQRTHILKPNKPKTPVEDRKLWQSKPSDASTKVQAS